MLIFGASGRVYLLSGGRLHHITNTAALGVYQSMGLPGSNSNAVNAQEEAALVASFPAGNPSVTVNSTLPNLSITGTVTPQ